MVCTMLWFIYDTLTYFLSILLLILQSSALYCKIKTNIIWMWIRKEWWMIKTNVKALKIKYFFPEYWKNANKKQDESLSFYYPICILYMAFTTEEFLEVATDSWLEGNLKTPSLNSIYSTEPSSHEFNSHSEPTLYSYSDFIFRLVFKFHLGHCLRQSPNLI